MRINEAKNNQIYLMRTGWIARLHAGFLQHSRPQGRGPSCGIVAEQLGFDADYSKGGFVTYGKRG